MGWVGMFVNVSIELLAHYTPILGWPSRPWRGEILAGDMFWALNLAVHFAWREKLPEVRTHLD